MDRRVICTTADLNCTRFHMSEVLIAGIDKFRFLSYN